MYSSEPFCPTRASSWNQISMGLPAAPAGKAAVTDVAKFFKIRLGLGVFLRVNRTRLQSRHAEATQPAADGLFTNRDGKPRRQFLA
jgi:hypothetical protein